jgi:hypothetical protein
VYLRLLTLKDQFRDFDRLVTVERDPPLGLRFRQPVLLAEDLDALIGAPPTASATVGRVTVRTYAFIHIGLPPANEAIGGGAPAAQMTLSATLVDGLLVAISFPPVVFNALDPRLAEAGLRSLARAEVNTVARTATSTLNAPGLPLPPDRGGLLRIFGQPSFADQRDGLERWVYRYRLVAGPGPAKPVIAAIAFSFAPTTDHPARFAANVNGLWLSIALPTK